MSNGLLGGGDHRVRSGGAGSGVRQWEPPPRGVPPAADRQQQARGATVAACVLFGIAGIALLALTALYLELALHPANLLSGAPRPGAVWVERPVAWRALLTLGVTGVAGLAFLLTAALGARQLRRAWSWWPPSAAVLARTGLLLLAACSLAVAVHGALPGRGEGWSPPRIVVVVAAGALGLLALVLLRALWRPTAQARPARAAGAALLALAACFVSVAADSGAAPVLAGVAAVPPPPHRFPTGLLSLVAGVDPARVAATGGLDWAAAGFASVSESDPGLALSVDGLSCVGGSSCLLLASASPGGGEAAAPAGMPGGAGGAPGAASPSGAPPTVLGVLSATSSPSPPGTSPQGATSSPSPPGTSPQGASPHGDSPHGDSPQGASPPARRRARGPLPARTPGGTALPQLLDERVAWLPGQPGSLRGLACTTPASCIAGMGGGLVELRITGKGGSATVRGQPALLPAGVGADASVAGASCPTPFRCFAVGIERGDAPRVPPGSAVLLRSRGGRPFALLAPVPGGGSWLALTCPNPWRCLVGGSLTGRDLPGGAGAPGAVAVVRRRRQSLALLPPGSGPVEAIACHRSTCLAVSGTGLLRSSDGGATWSSVTLPASVRAQGVRFSAVDCVSTWRCAAAGSAAPPSGQPGPTVGALVLLVGRDRGRIFRQMPMPPVPMVPSGLAYGAGAWQLTGSEVQSGALDTAGSVYAWNGQPDQTGVVVSVTPAGRSSVLVGPPLPTG